MTPNPAGKAIKCHKCHIHKVFQVSRDASLGQELGGITGHSADTLTYLYILDVQRNQK